MKTSNKLFISSAILFVAFLVFTVLIMFVDVKPIGPMNSEVGFASLNGKIFDALRTNSVAKLISEILGFVAIGVGLCFCFLFVIKIIKAKSLKKFDKSLFALCLFYVVIGVVYVLFLFIKINYRPVLIDDKLELSYPSSHTMLLCSILLSAVFYLDYFIKNAKLRYCFQILFILLAVVGVICRMLSGVHWFTDIIAGIVLSGALILLLLGVKNVLTEEDVFKKKD